MSVRLSVATPRATVLPMTMDSSRPLYPRTQYNSQPYGSTPHVYVGDTSLPVSGERMTIAPLAFAMFVWWSNNGSCLAGSHVWKLFWHRYISFALHSPTDALPSTAGATPPSVSFSCLVRSLHAFSTPVWISVSPRSYQLLIDKRPSLLITETSSFCTEPMAAMSTPSNARCYGDSVEQPLSGITPMSWCCALLAWPACTLSLLSAWLLTAFILDYVWRHMIGWECIVCV